MVVRTLGGTGEVSFGPFPSFRTRPLPPAGSPSLRCYVESWLTAFPPFMVGVPELFLERCLSSISCSDGSLYIQTVEKMESQGKGWKRGEERRGEWGQWRVDWRDGCADRDKVRCEAGTIIPGWEGEDRGIRPCLHFFITLLDKLLQQYLCDILTKLPQKICKLLRHWKWITCQVQSPVSHLWETVPECVTKF